MAPKPKFPKTLRILDGKKWTGKLTVECRAGENLFQVQFDAEAPKGGGERFVYDRTQLTAEQIEAWTGVNPSAWDTTPVSLPKPKAPRQEPETTRPIHSPARVAKRMKDLEREDAQRFGYSDPITSSRVITHLEALPVENRLAFLEGLAERFCLTCGRDAHFSCGCERGRKPYVYDVLFCGVEIFKANTVEEAKATALSWFNRPLMRQVSVEMLRDKLFNRNSDFQLAAMLSAGTVNDIPDRFKSNFTLIERRVGGVISSLFDTEDP